MTKEEIKLQIYRDIKEGVGGDYGFFSVGFDFGYNQADQQTKELQEKYDELDKDYSILNDQFVKSKEWNLEIVYSNKFKDKEIKQLQARIDELEKALKESVIVLNGVDFSLFYKDEEEKANKLINKIYQLTEPTNK